MKSTWLALFVFSSFAQQPAPSPAPGPAPSPSPTPGPSIPSPTTPGQTRPGQQQPQDPFGRSPFPEMERPIFLSGKVVMDDGTAPPETVVIERVCNGMPRPEAYTDSKGRFSFQLGQNQHMIPDASVSSQADMGFPDSSGRRTGGMPGMGNSRPIRERDLIGCELRAALPGHRSESVNLSGRRVMDNPDVGTIILRRLGNVEGLTISATSLNAPKDARKAFEKGKEQSAKKKLDEAQKELEKAVSLYPKYAVAWYELGLVHERKSKVEDARSAYG
ncbi:MAG: tetratricopeptide repeat protein, partial [Bryobacteraceae bacterium]